MRRVLFGVLIILLSLSMLPASQANIFDEYTPYDYYVYNMDYFQEFEDKDNTADEIYREYTYKGNYDGLLGFELNIMDYYDDDPREHPNNDLYSNYRVDPETGYVFDEDNEPIIFYDQQPKSILHIPNTMDKLIGDTLDPYFNFTITDIRDHQLNGRTIEVIEVYDSTSNSTVNSTLEGLVERSMGFFVDLRIEADQSFYLSENGTRVEKDYFQITTWSLDYYHIQNRHGKLTVTESSPETPPTFTRQGNFYGEYPLTIQLWVVLLGIGLPVVSRRKLKVSI